MDQHLQILALSSTKARFIREGSVRIGSEMKSNTFFSVQSIVSFNIWTSETSDAIVGGLTYCSTDVQSAKPWANDHVKANNHNEQSIAISGKLETCVLVFLFFLIIFSSAGATLSKFPLRFSKKHNFFRVKRRNTPLRSNAPYPHFLSKANRCLF